MPDPVDLARVAVPLDAATPVDRVLFQGPVATIGAFRCPVGHPMFGDSGPIHQCLVAFPRTSVWIRHEGSRSFVADPNTVTIYNRAQRYARTPLSPDGDRCEWFALSDQVAREIAGAFDAGHAEREVGPFPFERAPSTPALYLAQRRVALLAATAAADVLETEESVIGIVAQVIALAHQGTPRGTSSALAHGAAARRRRHDLVEHAKAELARTITCNRSPADMAQAVGTSVFHLCRVFRALTGRSMHAYRTELRIRLALELLAGARVQPSLSEVAHTLGFASHAHFVRLCRGQLGAAPRAVRDQLRVTHVLATSSPAHHH